MYRCSAACYFTKHDSSTVEELLYTLCYLGRIILSHHCHNNFMWYPACPLTMTSTLPCTVSVRHSAAFVQVLFQCCVPKEPFQCGMLQSLLMYRFSVVCYLTENNSNTVEVSLNTFCYPKYIWSYESKLIPTEIQHRVSPGYFQGKFKSSTVYPLLSTYAYDVNINMYRFSAARFCRFSSTSSVRNAAAFSLYRCSATCYFRLSGTVMSSQPW